MSITGTATIRLSSTNSHVELHGTGVILPLTRATYRDRGDIAELLCQLAGIKGEAKQTKRGHRNHNHRPHKKRSQDIAHLGNAWGKRAQQPHVIL